MLSETLFANRKEVLSTKTANQLTASGSLIRNSEVRIETKNIKGITFRNGDLIAEEQLLEHCHFENCDLIECKEFKHCSLNKCDAVLVYDGQAARCKFARLGSMHLQNTVVFSCHFDHIRHHEDII